MQQFANPTRFLSLANKALPYIWSITILLFIVGLYGALVSAPPDYQQGETVRIMFIHVPAAWLGMFAYLCLGIASLLALVFRHALADAAARSAAPLGAAFTALALITGSLWGRPMWGTWWVWDARLTSVLVLFLFYLGYMALRAGIDDEARGGRAAAILALVGLVNLPIVHFSVEWWNSLHQGSSTFGAERGDVLPAVYATPLALMGLGYLALFGSLWLVRIRAEVWRRRATVLALKRAEG